MEPTTLCAHSHHSGRHWCRVRKQELCWAQPWGRPTDLEDKQLSWDGGGAGGCQDRDSGFRKGDLSLDLVPSHLVDPVLSTLAFQPCKFRRCPWGSWDDQGEHDHSLSGLTGIELLNANSSSSSRVKSTPGRWELTPLCSHRAEVSGKAELWCRRWGCGIFSSAWWQLPKVRVSGSDMSLWWWLSLQVTYRDWFSLSPGVLSQSSCRSRAQNCRSPHWSSPSPVPSLVTPSPVVMVETGSAREGARVDGMHLL